MLGDKKESNLKIYIKKCVDSSLGTPANLPIVLFLISFCYWLNDQLYYLVAEPGICPILHWFHHLPTAQSISPSVLIV